MSKKFTYALKSDTHGCLCEALRRFECFAVKGSHGRFRWNLADIQRAWTGLGYKTEYKQAVADGYMIPLRHQTIQPRCLTWFTLTEKGARIILYWHRKGFKCEDHELKTTPPMKVAA